jgi:hypothetical protein
MTLMIYIGKDFQDQVREYQYPHEVQGFRYVCEHLWDKFSHQDRVFALIADTRRTATGREIGVDMTLVSEFGLGLIDLKHYFGVINCMDSHGAWRAGSMNMKPNIIDPGSNHNEGFYTNPHQQIQDYGIQIREDLIQWGKLNWFPRGFSGWESLKIHTAICFTHPDAFLMECKEAVRKHYRPGKTLKDWEVFSILTPAETPMWALDMRFEIEMGSSNWYRNFTLTPYEVNDLALNFFKAVPWKEMISQMHAGREPFGYLLLIEQNRPIQYYRLDRDELIIGRSPEICNVVIPDRYDLVSRKHARIIRSGNMLYIEDVGSKYGTYVNGTQVDQRTILRGQDEVIALGGLAERGRACLLKFTKDAPPPLETGHSEKMSG